MSAGATGSAPPRRRGAGLRGLRPRLILAFVLVAFTTGIVTSGLAYIGFVYLATHGYVVGALSFLARRIPRVTDANSLSVRQLLTLLAATVLGLLLFTVVLALLAAQRVLRPVGGLADAAGRIAEGDLRIRLAVRGEDELADLARTFNEMAAALERTVADLRRLEAQARRFAADVSHELRTPLAAMTAVTDVLDEQADNLTGDAAAAARLVSNETRNLNRLVDDLIEISRFDAGTAQLTRADVNLADAVRNCLRVRGWFEDVTTDLPPDLVVSADPRRLDVIVSNLVGNALRHGAPPVSASVRTEEQAGARWVALEIRDRGPGLASHVLPHVFDRFYKADTARTRSEGSGLGLAIAWENARLHGGSIAAANRADGGCAFTVRLPLDHAVAHP